MTFGSKATKCVVDELCHWGQIWCPYGLGWQGSADAGCVVDAEALPAVTVPSFGRQGAGWLGYLAWYRLDARRVEDQRLTAGDFDGQNGSVKNLLIARGTLMTLGGQGIRPRLIDSARLPVRR